MSGKIFIPIVTGFDKKGIDQASSALGGLGNALKKMGTNMAQVGQAGSLAFLTQSFKDSITAARDLQRNFVALDTVFGKYSGRMKDFANSSQEFGLSSVDSAKASVFLGSVLKQSGFEMGNVTEQTQKLVRLASDLATTYGYDVSEALTGMTALFRGEYDPIEKFGVAMKQAEVNALLASRSQNKLTGEALRHAQAVARLDLLYQRAADSMGSFIRQGDSLFVAEKKMSASMTNMEARLGQVLNKPFADVLMALQETMTSLEPQFQRFYNVVASLVTSLTPLITVAGEFLNSVLSIVMPLIDGLSTAVGTLTPLLAGLNEFFTPLYDIMAGISEFINMIVKWVSVLVKLLGIALLAIGKMFGAILGGAFNEAGKSIVELFKSGSDAADDLNAALDKTIEQMTAVKDKAEQIKPKFDFVDKPSFFAPAKRRTAFDDFLDTLAKARSAVPEPGKTEEDLKKLAEAFKNLKASIAESLNELIPGDLIEREVGRLENAVIGTYNNIQKSITAAITDGVLSKYAAKGLLAYAKTELDVLGKLARKRDELANKYGLAKNLIDDIKKATIGFANLAELMGSVSEDVVTTVTTITDNFSISVTKSKANLTNAETIINRYRDVVARTKAFVSDIKQLQNLNLNKTLLKQIVDMGLESGSAFANALVTGGAGAVKDLNSAFGDLASLGSQLGETTAQVMYGAGIDASQGLLDGILSLDEQYRKAAEKLADTFTTSFNKGVAAKSASGLRVDTSAATDLLANSSFRAASASSPKVFNINVNAGIGTDGASVGQQIVTAIKKYERVSGKVFATV